MILITKVVTDDDDDSDDEVIDSENGYHDNVDLLMNSDDGEGGETGSSSEYRDDDDGEGREKGGCDEHSDADDEGEDDDDNEKDVAAYVGVWEKKKNPTIPSAKMRATNDDRAGYLSRRAPHLAVMASMIDGVTRKR